MADYQQLRSLIVTSEGFSPFPYLDSVGKLTIGYGRNLVDRGISASEALYLLDQDIFYFESRLRENLKCFDDLCDARKMALIAMCFNLGVHGFLKFEKTIHALELGRYDEAAFEMLNSKWATQVGKRATDLSRIIESGEMP